MDAASLAESLPEISRADYIFWLQNSLENSRQFVTSAFWQERDPMRVRELRQEMRTLEAIISRIADGGKVEKHETFYREHIWHYKWAQAMVHLYKYDSFDEFRAVGKYLRERYKPKAMRRAA